MPGTEPGAKEVLPKQVLNEKRGREQAGETNGRRNK